MVADNRGRGRGNRKRNKRNKQQHQGPKKVNVPLPAQTKLVWRNISSVEKYGTVEKVLQMVQKVVAIANEKNANQYTIEMDRSAMHYLIREEELANKYLQDFKASQEATEETKEDEEEGEEESKEEGEKPEGEEVAEETKVEEQQLDVVVAPKQHSSIPLITARPLYVNPPRKTRRHGDKVGCAYILLTAPKIEKIEVPSNIPPEIMEVAVPEEEEDKAVPPATEGATEPPAPEAPKTEETKEEEEAPATPAEETKEGEAAPANPAEEKLTQSMLDHQAAINKALAADYSTAVAKGRLLVSRAIEFLDSIASEDAKGPLDLAGCKIETAMSGKTWRHQYRPDRREGTIESTNEYKNWLNSLSKKKEELESRPKPAPGGGAANNLVGLVDSAAGQEQEAQPVAAIVQHLRAKRQELKRKKTKKKKEKNEKAGGKNKKKEGGRGAAQGGGAGGGAKKKKKKGGGGGKKKGGGGGAKKPTTPTIAPPTALLKPGGGGGVAR